MNESEYNAELKRIESNARREREILNEKYALSISEFKVGDIIRDRYTNTIMKINSFEVYTCDKKPSPLYLGEQLTQKLKPFKIPRRNARLFYGRCELLRGGEL